MTEEILKKALGGGVAGAGAMCFQVSSLMWLRTSMNYQYRHGGNLFETVNKLFKEGGIIRFYRGYAPAIILGPLSRFGDMASYTYCNEKFKDTDTFSKTLISSSMAISWRLAIMPIDVVKTSLQVNGSQGLSLLKSNIKTTGPKILFNGAAASMTANFVGYYPWFLTYDYLQKNAPEGNQIVRNGLIGFCSAFNSDVVSNTFRVVKINKQARINDSYITIINDIIKREGIRGLAFRGLKTKILINGIQGMVFSVLFNMIKNNLN